MGHALEIPGVVPPGLQNGHPLPLVLPGDLYLPHRQVAPVSYTHLDVYKRQALALGARGVLIARPFVNMVYGGGEEGPAVLVAKLKAELEDTMLMCGAHSLAEIDRSMVR